MTCAEVEILLCDFLDGSLSAPRKSELELHLAECEPCAEMAQDITGVVAFMDRAAVVQAPPELMTRILHAAPATRQPWWRTAVGGWFEGILQPKYAMGMAMTVLSFSMIARFAGLSPRQLKPADLDPVKVWVAVDDRGHRSWDRVVKYYENLRWVLELQSRMKEFAEQDQEPAKPVPSSQSSDGRAEKK